MEITSSPGSRLRKERRRLKFTQQALAEATQISIRTQVNYEKDISPPDIHYLVCADAIGLDIMYVVIGKRIQQISENIFDWEILSQAIKATDSWLSERHLEFPHEKKMKLIRLLYIHFNGTGTNSIDEILSLAA